MNCTQRLIIKAIPHALREWAGMQYVRVRGDIDGKCRRTLSWGGGTSTLMYPGEWQTTMPTTTGSFEYDFQEGADVKSHLDEETIEAATEALLTEWSRPYFDFDGTAVAREYHYRAIAEAKDYGAMLQSLRDEAARTLQARMLNVVRRVEAGDDRGAALAAELNELKAVDLAELVPNQKRAFWFDPSQPHLCGVARMMADAVVGYFVKTQSRHSPALANPIHTDVERLAWQKRTQRRNGTQIDLLDFEDRRVATAQDSKGVPLVDSKIMQSIERGTNALNSIVGVRTLLHLLKAGHAHDVAARSEGKTWDGRMKWGSLTELADECELTSRHQRKQLIDILRAGQHWRISWGTGEAGGLWTYHFNETRGGARDGYVSVQLSDVLRYGHVFELDKKSRRMTPIVEIAPLVGNTRFYGNLAAFQQVIVREMSERRDEIAKYGGVELKDIELLRIARPLGVPKKTVFEARDEWLKCDPPFLVEVSKNRYHVADNHRYGEARAFLDEGATRYKKAARGGRKSRKRKNG